VVEVVQQAGFAIEESQAQKVVVEECEFGADDDVDEAESALAVFYRHLSAEGGIAIHVLDEAIESGMAVVQQLSGESSSCTFQLNGFVYQAIFDSSSSSAEKAQFGVRVITTVHEKAIEEEIFASHPEADWAVLFSFHDCQNFCGKFLVRNLVGIEQQNPISAAFFNRRILLAGIALPGFWEYVGPIAFGYLYGAVGAAGIYNDNLTIGLLHQRGDTLQRAAEVSLFVQGDDADRERHRLDDSSPQRHRAQRNQETNQKGTRKISCPLKVLRRDGHAAPLQIAIAVTVAVVLVVAVAAAATAARVATGR
jgi:hypothetical protein